MGKTRGKVKRGKKWGRQEVARGSDRNAQRLGLSFPSELNSWQGILESPNSLTENTAGFPKTPQVGANSYFFPPAVGLGTCTVSPVWVQPSPLPPTQTPSKACSLRPVTLPCSLRAYTHVLAQ